MKPFVLVFRAAGRNPFPDRTRPSLGEQRRSLEYIDIVCRCGVSPLFAISAVRCATRTARSIKFSSQFSVKGAQEPRGAVVQKLYYEERLPGKVKVEVHPNSTLFGAKLRDRGPARQQVQMLATRWLQLEAYTGQLQVFACGSVLDDLPGGLKSSFQKRDKSRELLLSMAKHGIWPAGTGTTA